MLLELWLSRCARFVAAGPMLLLILLYWFCGFSVLLFFDGLCRNMGSSHDGYDRYTCCYGFWGFFL
ncbi:hypothetical protein U1Q18_043399, partial [Sarracenia purpurea var. burkii]